MKTRTISIRLSKDEFEDIESLTKSEGYSSKTELIKELLKDKWNEWGEKALKNYNEHSEEYENWEDIRKRL